MGQPSDQRRLRSRGRSRAAFLVFLTWACCAGCQSGVYRASNLPPSLAAEPFASSRFIDLSQLAQPRPSAEQIFRGDVLTVAVATGLETRGPNRYTLRVLDDGQVIVPLIGPVRVEGMVLPQAENAIREASVRRGIYRNPQVAVQVADRRTIRVSVLGEVTRPGDYNLPAVQADLLAAVAMAGGFKSPTAGEIIEISYPPDPYAVQQASYPGGPPSPVAPRNVTVNLRELNQGRGGEIRLENGSAIMVAKKPPRFIYVQGLVKRPGQFEGLNDRDIRLLDAIAMAGGRTLEFADSVRIIRTIEGSDQPVVIKASVRDAKRGGPSNLLLASGDVVSVEETPVTFAWNTLRGFARIGFQTIPLGF